jgi:hypothetical protein
VSFHRSVSFTVFDALGNPLLHTIYQKDEALDLSYHISLEGGGKISDKVSIGLVLDIFSYQIFGDITTLGISLTF